MINKKWLFYDAQVFVVCLLLGKVKSMQFLATITICFLKIKFDLSLSAMRFPKIIGSNLNNEIKTELKVVFMNVVPIKLLLKMNFKNNVYFQSAS